MPRLYLTQSLYDLFVYDFPYNFFGIVGGYKLRCMCLHCDFFRLQTRTQSFRDLADIVLQPQGYRAVIVLSSQPPYINHTITLRLRKSQGVDTLTMQLSYNYVHGYKRPSMFIFGCTFELMTNRSMNGLVFLLNMVPRYGIDDTIQRVTFVYILMSIFKFCSFHKV